MPSIKHNPISHASPTTTTTPTSLPQQQDRAPARTYERTPEPPRWSVLTQHPKQTSGCEQTTNPDCQALGCDWHWGTQPCQCGQPHTFRICRRCLFSDDPVCAADADNDDDSAVTA